MTNLNHVTDYLEIKNDIKSLKKKIKDCSITGEIMGRKNELFVELLDEYIKMLKRQSWQEEFLR